MKKISLLDRIILIIMGIIAAYHVVAGLDGYNVAVTFYFTIAFGVLIIAGLLLILFGFEILDNRIVVVVAALIPLSLSLGLILKYLPQYYTSYLIFAIAGILLIFFTRYYAPAKIATIVLAVVHGIAGLVISFLPLILTVRGIVPPLFIFVGIGGALIGIGGLLLAFLKTGKPIVSRNFILSVLPVLLLLMTIAFVIGLSAISI